jgi:methylenetetrahydrofolate reductase (NADPH)
MRKMEELAMPTVRSRAAGASDVDAERERIVELVRDCSVEVTPRGADKINDLAQIFRPGTRVYVTSLAGQNPEDTFRTASRLRRSGLTPVPHITARSVTSAAQLDEMLARFVEECGVQEILLIAGGITHPLGEFDSAIQVLRTGLLQRHGIRRVGVAGHPEGNPDIPAPALQRALAEKNEFSKETGLDLHVVTQFCFDACSVIAWDQTITSAGNRLPVHVGIPGLATVGTLLKHAKACGVGPSIRFLTRQIGGIGKLMATSDPSALIRALARHRATRPDCGISRCHLYPFGGLSQSLRWLQAVQAGRFDFTDDGFDVALLD